MSVSHDIISSTHIRIRKLSENAPTEVNDEQLVKNNKRLYMVTLKCVCFVITFVKTVY